jgi:hypothetical protein
MRYGLINVCQLKSSSPKITKGKTVCVPGRGTGGGNLIAFERLLPGGDLANT